ncbi:hypothetical protein BC827DRAFT_1238208 [Russula dissimulans]|nr:hypothetical protein BC827DRAFT_1238208 [Russula dissimulans]
MTIAPACLLLTTLATTHCRRRSARARLCHFADGLPGLCDQWTQRSTTDRPKMIYGEGCQWPPTFVLPHIIFVWLRAMRCLFPSPPPTFHSPPQSHR